MREKNVSLISSLANKSGRVRPVTDMQGHNNELLGEKNIHTGAHLINEWYTFYH